MFCTKCGKEVEDTWVKCPYCGNILQENRKQGNVEQEKYVNAQAGINGNYIPNNTMLNNQPPKKKKKLPFIIGGVVVAVMFLFVLLLAGGDDSTPKEAVELSSYEGGFAGWEASGFEGSVKTDITIPYPLTDTGRNNYAVYIGVGKTNVGIIMQEDESAISEWDWLMNAQPDMEMQAYYFNCTLTYANQTAGENNTPVFVIENVQSYSQEITSDVVVDETVVNNEAVNDENVKDVNYDEIYTWILDATYVNVDNPEYYEWTLYDVNKDGYLELFVQSGTYNADMEYTVWTTDGTTALEVGSIYGLVTLYEYKDGNGVYTDYCNMGYEQVTRVSIENGVLVEEIVYEGQEPYGYDDEGVALEELSYLIQTSTLEEY